MRWGSQPMPKPFSTSFTLADWAFQFSGNRFGSGLLPRQMGVVMAAVNPEGG